MQKLAKWLSFFIAFALVACSSQPDAHDSQGKAISLNHYHGKWVIINYWATWCKPCLTELPALNQLYKNHPKQVVVLGVSFDQLSNQKINRIKQQYSLQFPMLSIFPMQKLGINNPVAVLPTTFIINPQGKLTAIMKGPRTLQQFAAAVHVQPRNNPTHQGAAL